METREDRREAEEMVTERRGECQPERMESMNKPEEVTVWTVGGVNDTHEWRSTVLVTG